MRSLCVGGRELCLEHGDITKVRADAIVNAANSRLAGGGGVDGAIHRAGGPSIMEECRRLGGCPTGEAVVTTAGNLPARWVVHAVGPVWRGGHEGEPELLARAYRSALRQADVRGARTLAFPSLSTGAYGYPVELAAPVALRTVVDGLRESRSVKKVTFVLFSHDVLRAYERALEEIAAGEVGVAPGDGSASGMATG
ncbi:MAG: O-acetyl-ADP-ribose deacetylase [Firmicutes bacterium]|nr:O-acetyl-ADP-ribose deacetylase [Bacillota bacterium]